MEHLRWHELSQELERADEGNLLRPMLFSTLAVLEILAGNKTVTRRPIDKDISNKFDIETYGTILAYIDQATGDSIPPSSVCKYKAGGILYVREAWRFVDFEHIDGDWNASVQYKADSTIGPRLHCLKNGADERIGWRPSIHMPREAARIFLQVMDVRVERLNDITEEGARAEGFQDKFMFMAIWDAIYKNALNNPWVEVISFRRIKKEEQR